MPSTRVYSHAVLCDPHASARYDLCSVITVQVRSSSTTSCMIEPADLFKVAVGLKKVRGLGRKQNPVNQVIRTGRGTTGTREKRAGPAAVARF